LNGVKKYITAGNQADFILVTARNRGDEKISQLFLLPVNAFAPMEMKSLDLKALRTTSHGRLALNDKKIPGHYHLPLSPAMLRKSLKVYGLVERSLILEAVLAMMIYLNRRMSRHTPRPPVDETAINELAVLQTGFSAAAIRQAQNGETVQPQWASDGRDTYPGEDLVERINDLRFIRSLWG